MQSWREFWDSDHAIYVNDRHKAAHQASITQDLTSLLPTNACALDFGCGETPLIKNIKTLYLCEGAPQILAKLKKHYGDRALSPEELEKIPPASLDFIIMVSVLQYLSLDEFALRLRQFHSLLSTQGQLIIGDIIDPKIGIAHDAFSLLKMGWKNGFFFAAAMGLVKTALSPYRQLRTKLGFTRLSEVEMCDFLAKNDFKAERLARNIGPHQHRYTLRATK